MDGPFNYTAPDPRADPQNWNIAGQYTGPDVEGYVQEPHPISPAGTTTDVMYSGYGAPPQPVYDPLSSAYQPAPGPPAQPAYAPESSAYTAPVQPTPGIFSPVAPGGTFTAQPSDYGAPTGVVDYNYTYDPTTAAAPVGVSAPPAAPGGAAAPAAAPVAAPAGAAAPVATDTSIPMTATTDPVTGQVTYTQPAPAPYGAPAYSNDPTYGGSGSGYGGGSDYSGYVGGGTAIGGAPGGFTFPNGRPFGAPHQMGANGQFDPFAWAGVGNPRPAPNASQLYVLQQLGLAPQPQAPPKPMGPIAYTAAKLGIEAPDVQFTFPNPMQDQQPPMPQPGAAPPQFRQLNTNAPQASAPQLPDLPLLPIPRRGNFRT